ncbi:MAG: hypothetical protein HYX59_07890 [Elusimicrobia bacterium]|nr:hypothetical protein [Elusimicrobiota bacterium]
MMTLILATFLTATPAPVTTAQFRPCVWPNTCTVAPATSTAPAPVVTPAVAQFQPCVWPKTCTVAPATSSVPAPVIASGPVSTCVWPNKCG